MLVHVVVKGGEALSGGVLWERCFYFVDCVVRIFGYILIVYVRAVYFYKLTKVAVFGFFTHA